MIACVADEAFNLFFILKADTNPEAGLDWRVLMKVKGLVVGIPIEGVDEEDGLGVGDRDIPDLAGVDHGEADAVEWMLRAISEQLLDGPEIDRAGIAPNRVVDEADDDFIACGGKGIQA